MGASSTETDKAALLRMVVGESIQYLILRIWDDRFAAFYKAGFETDHCIAVAQHQIYDDDWPFAFIGHNYDAVMRWAIESDSKE